MTLLLVLRTTDLDKILFCLFPIMRLQTYLVLEMLQGIGAPTRMRLGGYCTASYYPIFSNVTSSPRLDPPFPSMALVRLLLGISEDGRTDKTGS